MTTALARALADLASSNEPELREAAADVILTAATEHGLSPLPRRLLRPRRTAPLVDALELEPRAERSLAQWAEQLGMARSTLARACQDELGMPFATLRRIMQIHRAVEHLTFGQDRPRSGAARRLRSRAQVHHHVPQASRSDASPLPERHSSILTW